MNKSLCFIGLCTLIASISFTNVAEASDFPFWDQVQSQVQGIENTEETYGLLDADLSQRLVDWATLKLLKTETGKTIASQLLMCDAAAIYTHLGLTLNSSLEFSGSTDCNTDLQSEISFVRPAAEENLAKNGPGALSTNRSFEFIITKDTDSLLVDSWTHLSSQKTSLFFPANISEQQFVNQLLKSIAHENAIYFDAKVNIDRNKIGAPNSIFDDIGIYTIDSRMEDRMAHAYTAMRNPVLANVFSFMRAFRVEKKWLEELERLEARSYGSEEFAQGQYPFLEADCNFSCLRNFILQAAYSFSAYSLPLSAHSNYWLLKLDTMAVSPLSQQHANAIGLIIDTRQRYLNRYNPNHVMMTLLDNDQMDADLFELIQLSAEVFVETFIPDDIWILQQLTVDTYGDPVSTPILQWLSEPLLSNSGVAWSFGPRPRIRTGMGHPWLQPETTDEDHTTDSDATSPDQIFDGVIEVPTFNEVFEMPGADNGN